MPLRDGDVVYPYATGCVATASPNALTDMLGRAFAIAKQSGPGGATNTVTRGLTANRSG